MLGRVRSQADTGEWLATVSARLELKPAQSVWRLWTMAEWGHLPRPSLASPTSACLLVMLLRTHWSSFICATGRLIERRAGPSSFHASQLRPNASHFPTVGRGRPGLGGLAARRDASTPAGRGSGTNQLVRGVWLESGATGRARRLLGRQAWTGGKLCKKEKEDQVGARPFGDAWRPHAGSRLAVRTATTQARSLEAHLSSGESI